MLKATKHTFCLLVCFAAWFCHASNIHLAPLEKAFLNESVHLWATWDKDSEFQEHSSDIEFKWTIHPAVSDAPFSITATPAIDTWNRLADSETPDAALTVVLSKKEDTETLPASVDVTFILSMRMAENDEIQTASRVITFYRNDTLDTRKCIDIRKRLAVIRGLHAMQLRQHDDGSWGAAEDGSQEYHLATAAMMLWAFGNHGFSLQRTQENPFIDTIDKALEYILSHSDWEPPRAQSGYVDFDSNNDGFYLVLGGRQEHENYVNPICLNGIVSVGFPEYCVSTPTGLFTLGDAVTNSFDFIIRQIHEHNARGWYYNDLFGTDSPDLSIAGWNIMAIKAATLWGNKPSESSFLTLGNMIEYNFSDYENVFFYSMFRGNLVSENIDASGIMLLSLLSDETFGLDATQLAWPSERTDYDPPFSLGEIQLRMTQNLFRWVNVERSPNQGYSWWNVCKALMTLGVTQTPLFGGIYDWRYGGFKEEYYGGGPTVFISGAWETIMRFQDAETGRWLLDEENDWGCHLELTQHDMETALMLLALSEMPIHLPEPLAYDVDVSIEIPSSLGEQILLPNGMTKQKQTEHWLATGHFLLKEGTEGLDLTYGYVSENAKINQETAVQLGGNVQWTDEYGLRHELPLDKLLVQHIGNRYELGVAWEGSQCVNDTQSICTTLSLPQSSEMQLLRVPAGSHGDIVLFQSPSDMIATWLGIIRLDQNLPHFTLLTKPTEALVNWHVVDETALPSGMIRGRLLGMHIDTPPAQDAYFLLYYNTGTILLNTYVSNGEATRVLLQSRTITPAEFGKQCVQHLPVTTPKLQAGKAICMAELTKDGTAVLSATDTTDLFEQPSTTFDAVLRVAPTGTIGVHLPIRSSVFNRDEKPFAVTGNVDIVWQTPDGQKRQWTYDGKTTTDGRQESLWMVDTQALSPGTYTITQMVALSNGQTLSQTAQTHLTAPVPLKEIDEPDELEPTEQPTGPDEPEEPTPQQIVPVPDKPVKQDVENNDNVELPVVEPVPDKQKSALQQWAFFRRPFEFYPPPIPQDRRVIPSRPMTTWRNNNSTPYAILPPWIRRGILWQKQASSAIPIFGHFAAVPHKPPANSILPLPDLHTETALDILEALATLDYDDLWDALEMQGTWRCLDVLFAQPD